MIDIFRMHTSELEYEILWYAGCVRTACAVKIVAVCVEGRLQGSGPGQGSSAASRYWARQGLPEMSRKDEKDMIV
jgi:hypothetical protein